MIEFFWVAIALVGYFSLLTVGLNLQQGLAGLGNFGVVGFFAIGAYSMSVLTQVRSALGPADTLFVALGLPYAVAFPITLVVGAIVAWLLAKILEASWLDPLFVAILTLVFAEILHLVVSTEKQIVNGFNGIRGIARPFESWFRGFSAYDRALAISMVIFAVLAAAAYKHLSATPYGRALRAMRDDPIAIQSLGYDIRSYRMSAFILGSTVMVVAGAFWPLLTTVVEPSAFGFDVTLLVWASLVVGGTGSSAGPLIGCMVLIGLVQQGSRFLQFGDLPARIGPLLDAAGVGLMLVLFVLVRPEGIWRERPLKLAKFAHNR